MLTKWREFVSGDPRVTSLRLLASLVVFLFVAVVCYFSFFYDDGYSHWGCPFCDTDASSPGTLYELKRLNSRDRAEVPTNLSHIVFAFGSSARAWDERRRFMELWWRPGILRGDVWLDEPPMGPWSDACPPFRISPDNCSRFGGHASSSRIARIIADSYRLYSSSSNSPPVRWFVMGDDDTIFFPRNLAAVLGKYDHENMYYIGGSSESVGQNVAHSFGMAFGGGGFAVSYPAAAELSKAIDGCLARYSNFYGSDERVHSCLSELGIPLTREPGFHQMDLRGDAYGMLAAHPVAPLVSLHHLDRLKPIIPSAATQLDAVQQLLSAASADPARVLQQTICYEQGNGFALSLSVSWGYAAQLYPLALPAGALEIPLQTFQTWRGTPGPFSFNTRPLPGPCDRPVLFFLEKVRDASAARGATVTTYSRTGPLESTACEHQPGFKAAWKVSSVRVFAPTMDPAIWKNAPRRQCCRTKRRKWGKAMDVTIGNCEPGEITTPP